MTTTSRRVGPKVSIVIPAYDRDEVGGFDEGYRNGYEEVDLCLELRDRGHRIAYEPESVLYHLESVSPGRFPSTQQNEDRLMRKWMGRFEAFDVDRRTTRRPVPPRRGRPPLSVVVLTNDAPPRIAPCLEDLRLAVAPGDEIVVADAGSRDCTLAFVERFSAAHPGLVSVVHAPPGGSLAGAARAGHARASHDVRVQLPAAGIEGELLNDLAALLAGSQQKLVAVPAGPSGFCAAAGRATFAAPSAADPAAVVQPDAARLQRAFALREVGTLQLAGGALALSSP